MLINDLLFTFFAIWLQNYNISAKKHTFQIKNTHNYIVFSKNVCIFAQVLYTKIM